MKSYLFLALLLLALLPACKKNNDPNNKQSDPVINSVTPTTGSKATPVTIAGNNFGTDATRIKVFFNNVEANITKVENAKIECTVPAKAGTGVVKIVVNNVTVEGSVFTYIPGIMVSTFAGSSPGFVDAIGTAAKFWNPRGITVDAQGYVYVADAVGSHRIRKISPSGVVTTIAGNGTQGFTNGNSAVATFASPSAVAVDGQGNVYVGDQINNCIRKISTAGVVSIYAGTGVAGAVDGSAATAQFNAPQGVVFDNQGNLYVADGQNHAIRKISPSGAVSTLAGTGKQGYADGNGNVAQFNGPLGVTVDDQLNVYVADLGNDRIRKITAAGVVSTLAGGTYGFFDGIGSAAQFKHPYGVVVDNQRNVYVADMFNNRIRKVTPAGVVSTVAGFDAQGFTDGDVSVATFFSPIGITIDTQGNLYEGDGGNYRIRKITME